MMKDFVNNRFLLEFLIQCAREKTGSTRISSVFEAFTKIAQDPSAEIERVKKLVDRLQEDFYYMLRKKYSDNEQTNNSIKEERVKAKLQEYKNDLAFYLYSQAGNDDIRDALSIYIPTKLVEDLTKMILKINPKDLNLTRALNGVLGNAGLYARGIKQKEYKRQKKELSTEGAYGKDSDTRQESMIADTAPSAYDVLTQQDESASQVNKEENFEKLLSMVLNDPDQDILSLYIKEKILPEWSDVKNRLNTSTGRDLAQAEADFDQLVESTHKYIEANMGQKRKYVTKGVRENTLRDVQEFVNNAFKKLDIDSLTDHILSSNFHAIPGFVKRENPIVVKEIIKSLIKSTMIINMKEALEVPLPQASGVGKSRKILSQIDLMYHILVRNLQRMEQDPAAQQKLIREAAKAIGTTFSEKGEPIHKPKDALNYSLFMHATPLIISGLLKQEAARMGETFSEMSPEEQAQLIERVQGMVYPALPHTSDEGGIRYIRTGLHAMPEGETKVRESLLERLQQAQDIQRGKLKPGTFMKKRQVEQIPAPIEEMPPTEDEQNIKGSALNHLIQKYAFRR